MDASKAKLSLSMPIVSGKYCSSSEVVLVVRRRPRAMNGGGFMVTNCSQKVVFKVDGCGVHGKEGELMLTNAEGDPILLIRQKAMSLQKQWRCYSCDNEGLIINKRLMFSIKEPNACFFSRNNGITISIEPKHAKDWDFELKGSFPNRDCAIVDSLGHIIAQIGMKEEVAKAMRSKDFYHVAVKPGMDQAFVFGVIAVLDYIYHESTRCHQSNNLSQGNTCMKVSLF